MSYRANQIKPKEFAEIMTGIQDVYFILERKWIGTIKLLLYEYLNKLAKRRGGKDDEKARRFRMEITNNLEQILVDIMKPVKPLAVLCHGDFNRNNLMFRYDDHGKPVDVLVFDMATVRYGSPMLDLSFILYMNMDRETRDEHWDTLLDTYCTVLSAAVADMADSVQVPDRDQVDVEMRRHALFGLTQAAYFVRVMSERHKAVDTKEIFGLDHEEQVFQYIWALGSDEATDVIVDIVQHYLNLRYQ